ncbi:MAG: SBBP repeat-containing protein [Gammaproteobacteria bacterium]|nr:SBBP repeat-containing protein [Gammaproteobacteria bacterium]
MHRSVSLSPFKIFPVAFYFPGIRARACWVILLLWLVGCSSGHIKEYEAIYWPNPPDAPRYVYEGTLRNSEDMLAFTGGASFKTAITGGVPRGTVAFQKPYDIAARNGRIVISDTVSHVASIWDVAAKRVYAFGVQGNDAIIKPGGVGMDGRQWIYVADIGDHIVRVYDPLGMFIRQIGGPEDYLRPVDVAANVDGQRVYVVDSGGIDSTQHQVIIYDGDGNKLKSIGIRGDGPGEFNLPIQAAVAPDGTLYVLDAGNFRVQAFDSEGNYLRQWGKVGRNFGDFARPRGIAVDEDGNIYVTDSAFRNFQIFNPAGELLMAIGGETYDDLPGQYSLPAGIAVDERNNVFVVDQILGKVDIIRKLSPGETAK